MAQGTILVVDDDPDVRDALELALELDGWQVVSVPGGKEALARLGRRDPPIDLILLDLMMPGMTGAEFRRRQRQEPSMATVPVVVISAAEGLSSKLGDIQPDDFLAKPVELDALIETVRAVHDRASAPR